jgi:hypothetical protein
MLSNRVVRRIFGSKKDGVTEGRRELHGEELRDFKFHQVKL